MTKINDGGPAFPGAFDQPAGMSLRDWFAGQAMTGWLASLEPNEVYHAVGAANFVYTIADAMLAVRNGGQDDE